jgi:hypothetical protein
MLQIQNTLENLSDRSKPTDKPLTTFSLNSCLDGTAGRGFMIYWNGVTASNLVSLPTLLLWPLARENGTLLLNFSPISTGSAPITT